MLGPVVHFRPPISCQSDDTSNDICQQNLRAEELVLVFSNDSKSYSAFRRNSDENVKSILMKITDTAEMPWGLPPNGNYEDFYKALGTNVSTEPTFTGLTFRTKTKTLYLLSILQIQAPKLRYKTMTPEASFPVGPLGSVEISPGQNFSMMVTLPDDKSYAFIRTPQGIVVSEMELMGGQLTIQPQTVR